MENKPLVFLFIKEETQASTSRRICKLEAALEQLDMEGRAPHDEETAQSLLSDPNFKPSIMIINVEHPDLRKILDKAKTAAPSLPIVLLYSQNSADLLSGIEKEYNIKADLERNKISKITLNSKILQIRSDQAFTQIYTDARYTFIYPLGNGSTGTVDLYRDNETGMEVAVKKIKVEGMKQLKDDKVQNEVKNMQRIKVPTSIQFYELKMQDDNRFIFMEYANQGTLQAKIDLHKQEGTKFDMEEIFDFTLEILLALFALNQNGMMHRDIKSENILLKTQNVNGKEYTIAKLSDLGISRQIDGVVGSLTTCGTPYYVSPEISSFKTRYEKNADIWSLGVVLYELITLNKPWYDPMISSEELFQLVYTTKYPPLPEETDKRLKYLVKIMLKKDPSRRATLNDILCLDFVYKAVNELIKKYNWEECEAFKSIKDLEKNVKPCYLFVNLLSEDIKNYLSDARKLFVYTQNKEYRPSYFGSVYKYARNGADLIDLFNDLPNWENATLNYKEETINNLILNLITNGIIICLSHTIKDVKNEEEVNSFIEKFVESPKDYYFKFPCCEFESNGSIDNNIICGEIEREEKIDYLVLSQFILKQCINVYKNCIKNNVEEDQLAGDECYINFLYGISLFNNCDIAEIPFDEKNHSRLAFLLNLYQIMFFHHSFNLYQNNQKTKSGLFSFLQYDISITYQFKDMTLNNLELKHVVFRNNKQVPGSYLRLVYPSDKKCTFLPGYTNLQPLLMMVDFNQDISTFTYKIFSEKEVDFQLNDITYKFMLNNVNLSVDDELYISAFIKPILTDFGPNNTPDFPEDFLRFLVEYAEKPKDLLKDPKNIYLLKMTEEEVKSLYYLTRKFIREVGEGVYKVNYA